MARISNTAAPVQKVAFTGISGAITTVLVFVLNSYILPTDKPIDASIAAALTTIIGFVVGYLTPPGANEQIIQRNPTT